MNEIRRTKIVCTLGPASANDETIGTLIDGGMNVVRLNFSHGVHEQHRETFARVRKIAEQRGQAVAIMQDLQGPKIRVGRLPDGETELQVGKTIELLFADSVTAKQLRNGLIPQSYEALTRDAKVDDRILLDDGRLELEVVGIRDDRVRCRVVQGGILKERKGINLPGMALSIPALTKKDREDLRFGIELGVDVVALSFVRSAGDVRMAQQLAGDIPIIAKIEKPEALENINEIIDVADGVMVARGDLGVEMPAEKVPLVQKHLVEQTNRRGKLVIIATDMLDSMRENLRPTRAEVSDVANAILDGADAVMLSGETATGKYPVESLRTMARVALETERSARYQQRQEPPLDYRRESTNAIARAAVVAAREIDATQIICFSESGYTARLLSDYRPPMPIVAGTDRPPVFDGWHWSGA